MKKSENTSMTQVEVKAFLINLKTNKVTRVDLRLPWEKESDNIGIIFPRSNSFDTVMKSLDKVNANRDKLKIEISKVLDEQLKEDEVERKVAILTSAITRAADEIGIKTYDVAFFHIDRLNKLQELRSSLESKGFTEDDFALLRDYYDDDCPF